MLHKLFRVHSLASPWHRLITDEVVALVLVVLVIAMPVSASTRFEDRGLFMQSSVPSAVTTYKLSLRYMSPDPVGSLDMKFCMDPIPYKPCVTPPGLDLTNIDLSDQLGEVGFSIVSKSSNHIVLGRTNSVAPASGDMSTYTFTGIKNPNQSAVGEAFSIRLKSLSSSDGTGPQIDFGSVRGQVTNAIHLETQVPPMLKFCAAEQVSVDCQTSNDVYYRDMGQLSPSDTLTAQSQMAVGTNASAGFAITVNGTPPSAGINTVDPMASPTASTPGSDQFGINLVENSGLNLGHNPEGPWTNAQPTSDYSQPNMYKFAPGDVVASSPNVSLMRKFTVSYVMNSAQNLHPGVYTTTITFIASGRF